MAIHLEGMRLPHFANATISTTTITVLLVPPGCVVKLLGDTNALKVTTVNNDGESLTLSDDAGTFPTDNLRFAEYSATEVAAGLPALQTGNKNGTHNGVSYAALGLAKGSGNVALRVVIEPAEGSVR